MLLVAMSRGDEQALAELYDRFGGVAYGLALRTVRDAQLAQDAVQDAFLAAWRTAASFDPRRGKVSTWLLTLVHRRAVDVVRREERRRGAQLDDDTLDADTGETTEETAEIRAQRRARPGSACRAPTRPARGARARLLRRAHPIRARRAPGHPSRHRQEPHVHGALSASRAPGDGGLKGGAQCAALAGSRAISRRSSAGQLPPRASRRSRCAWAAAAPASAP